MAQVVITGDNESITVDAPSNSKKRQVAPVVTNKVSVKKGSLAKRIFSEFITCDLSTVAETTVNDILIPYIKDAIVDSLHDGIDMMFGGKPRGRTSSRGSTYVNYSSYSKDNSPRRERTRERVHGYNFKEIILSTRAEAEDVVEHMIDILEEEGCVTVADLYSLVGIKSAYTDETYGWTNLKSVFPQHVRDGYILNLPRPILL